MRALASLSLVVLCLHHAGCGSCSAGPRPDEASLRTLGLASAEALAGVVFAPERWPALRERVASLVAPLSPALRAELPPVPGPHALAAGLLGDARALLDPTPEGLDVARPFAIGAFVGADDALARVEALATARPGDGQRGVRWRLVLPASSPAALAAALDVRCREAGFASMREVGGAGGAGLCATFAERDHVRVELVRDDGPGADPSAWRAAWLARVSPTPAPAATGVALEHASLGRAVMGIYLDARRLRDAGAAQGAAAVASALGGVEPELGRVLLPVGLGEILSGYDLLAPERALVAELGLALEVEGGYRLSAVAHLTTLGADALGAARAAVGPHLGAEGGPAVEVRLGLSLRELLARAPAPAVFEGARDAAQGARDLGQALRGCGFACSLGAALDPGLFARVMMAEAFAGAPAPTSLALAVTPTPDAARDFPLAITVALGDDAAGSLAEPLRKAVGDGPGESAPSLERTPSSTREGASVVRLGYGPVDRRPRIVEGADDALLAARVDFGALGELLAWGLRRQHLIAGLAPGLGAWEVRFALRDGVLAGALAAAPPGEGLGAIAPPALSAEPAPAPPLDDASRCLTRAVAGLADALQFGQQVSPEQAPLAIARAQVEAEPHLRCAEADPRTRADAARLRAIAAALLPPLPRP